MDIGKIDEKITAHYRAVQEPRVSIRVFGYKGFASHTQTYGNKPVNLVPGLTPVLFWSARHSIRKDFYLPSAGFSIGFFEDFEIQQMQGKDIKSLKQERISMSASLADRTCVEGQKDQTGLEVMHLIKCWDILDLGKIHDIILEVEKSKFNGKSGQIKRYGPHPRPVQGSLF